MSDICAAHDLKREQEACVSAASEGTASEGTAGIFNERINERIAEGIVSQDER